jgi:CheY-like chemotaxis protein
MTHQDIFDKIHCQFADLRHATLLRARVAQLMNCMNPEVRIVFIEDVPAEAALVEQALQRGGLAVQMQRVETREDFLRVLASQPPDVILSDHGLPSFNGFEALAVAREKCPRVPFIFVTNALTRDMEIEKLEPGVADFVLKSQLRFLAPVVRRVLRGTEPPQTGGVNHEELRQIEEKLLTLLAEYERAGGYLPICSSCKKIRDGYNVWQPPEVFFRSYAGLKFTHGICPDCIGKFSS